MNSPRNLSRSGFVRFPRSYDSKQRDRNLRTDKELLQATKAFASDDRLRSWWCLTSTLVLYIACLAICFSPLAMVARVSASFISALLIVRLFIIYHDFQHHAILVHSRLAASIMYVYGLFVLSQRVFGIVPITTITNTTLARRMNTSGRFQ